MGLYSKNTGSLQIGIDGSMFKNYNYSDYLRRRRHLCAPRLRAAPSMARNLRRILAARIDIFYLFSNGWDYGTRPAHRARGLQVRCRRPWLGGLSVIKQSTSRRSSGSPARIARVSHVPIMAGESLLNIKRIKVSGKEGVICPRPGCCAKPRPMGGHEALLKASAGTPPGSEPMVPH